MSRWSDKCDHSLMPGGVRWTEQEREQGKKKWLGE